MKPKLPKPLNEGEERFALQLRAARIPFEREYQFAPPRKWKFDFLLPAKLAVEIEGGSYSGGRHTRGSGFVADMAKYNAAIFLGYRLLRYTPDQIKAGDPIRDIEAFLAANPVGL